MPVAMANVISKGQRLDADSAYGSHLPALAEMVLRTQGGGLPVMEQGGGLYSTPLLSMLCRMSGRRLVTVETDPAFTSVASSLAAGNPLHDVVECVPDDVEVWGVVLVDGPVADRQPLIRDLADRAVFVVVHDTLGWSGYEYDFGMYRWRRDFAAVRPGTSVLSNVTEP